MSSFIDIEKKWQKYWEDNDTFKAITGDKKKDPYYILVEFPYPSGSGLHVGHVRSYTALDAMARMKRMQGFNVLYPMGWDSFGAPAEQYAIKNHIHPSEAVKENIKTFKAQMQSLGFSFDWSREFATTDPDYYKWTQWQFLQFYKHDMAYKDTIPVNWCPECKTVLSNEDAAGGVCERCGSQVEQKEKSQWMLRMSDYAEDLLTGLDDTNFAERVKLGQINWIGKSTGVELDVDIVGGGKFSVFTTCPETIYGITFFVIAPDGKLIKELMPRVKNKKEALDFIKQIKTKYADATHNVYAYIINNENLKKSSDDGEPKGTAGMPILSVLCGFNLTDIAIVVTRYFGGILLGAGGLVRAYSTTAKNALANAELVDVKVYAEVVIELKYSLYSMVNALLNQFKTMILNTAFFDKIHIEFKIEQGLFEKFKTQILDVCNGDITIIKRDDSLDF